MSISTDLNYITRSFRLNLHVKEVHSTLNWYVLINTFPLTVKYLTYYNFTTAQSHLHYALCTAHYYKGTSLYEWLDWEPYRE